LENNQASTKREKELGNYIIVQEEKGWKREITIKDEIDRHSLVTGQPNQIKGLSQPEVPDPKYKRPTHAG
jgi:hypothetical protein